MNISTTTPDRVAAASLILAGVLVAVVESVERLAFPSGEDLSVHFQRAGVAVVEAVSWLYLLLILLALPALHRRHADRTGRMGLVMYLVLYATLGLTLSSVWSASVVFPDVAAVAPAFVDGLGEGGGSTMIRVVLPISLFGSLLALIGYSIMSIVVRSGPPLAWGAVALGFALSPAVPIVGPVIAGGGLAWLGRDISSTPG